ncbi:hypothetical protein ES703_72629 [subsurface metagenome]
MVGDLHQQLTILGLALHYETTTTVTELDGVAQQINHHLANSFPVCLYLGQCCWNILTDYDTLVTG